MPDPSTPDLESAERFARSLRIEQSPHKDGGPLMNLARAYLALRLIAPSTPGAREPDAMTRLALMKFQLSQLIGFAVTAKGEGDGRDWKRVESEAHRIADLLFTEQAMHHAWRKRAEEAEAASPASPGATPVGERDIRVAPSDPGDWTEDFAHENGQYQCKCRTCGQLFIGHKRRVTCRVCASPASLAEGAGEVVDDEDNPLRALADMERPVNRDFYREPWRVTVQIHTGSGLIFSRDFTPARFRALCAAPASSGPAGASSPAPGVRVTEEMVERMAVMLFEWDAGNNDQWPKKWSELTADSHHRGFWRDRATEWLTAALSGSGATGGEEEKRTWVIIYEDQDIKPLFYNGTEHDARVILAQQEESWACHLFAAAAPRAGGRDA